MKILLADDERFRRFVRPILEREKDLKVVGVAVDAEEVARLTRQLKPDVVLMDIDLPGVDGLTAVRHIKASLPATKIIMLSAVDGEAYRKAAANSGADAFLPKSAPISEILSVIRHGVSVKAVPGKD